MISVPEEAYRPVVNDGATHAPPFGIMRIVSIDSDGIAHVEEPNGTVTSDGVLINGPTWLFTGHQGQGHRHWPAMVAYDESTGETPATGESWGIEADNWRLVKCQQHFLILGGASRGIVNALPKIQGTFPAKITRRHSATCGHTTGSPSTQHTLYTYDFIRGRYVYDADSCFEFEPDFTLGSGTAYESSNRKISVGSIVNIETAFADALAGGSGHADGCVYIFTGQETNFSRYRYICFDGILREYIEDDNGLTFVRENGCCACSGSGSGGSGSGGCGCSADPTSLCISFALMTGSDCPAGPCGCVDLAGKSFTLPRTSTSANGSDYNLEVPQAGHLYPLHLHVGWNACRHTWTVSVYHNFGGADWQLFAISTQGNCATSFSGTYTMTAPYACGSPPLPSYLVTVNFGSCAGGGGSCACSWKCSSLIWMQQSGDTGCITPTFGYGYACGTGNEGEVVYTNNDGTQCVPSEPTCNETGTADKSISITGTGFFAVMNGAHTMTYNAEWGGWEFIPVGGGYSIFYMCNAGTAYLGFGACEEVFTATSGPPFIFSGSACGGTFTATLT